MANRTGRESTGAGGGRGRVHPGAAAAWGLFAAAIAVVWIGAPDEAAVRSAFDRLGPLAPAAFVVLEIVQVVVAPVPGQPVEVPGGWLLGLVPGTVLGSAGAFVGSLAAFGIARRYGRPRVERWIPDKVRGRVLKRLERGRRMEWIVFWLMMIPSFPRDPLCYLAGLTTISPARFALIAAVGRPVGLAPWVALGAEGVAVGIEVQLALAALAGLVWLVHAAVHRSIRGRVPSEPDAETTSNTIKGERYA